MDLSERKLKILQAIVGDFIRTGEPVGSRTISKKYDLGVSAATIRNEMSDLEDMGFLTHPHTSAGRVPSDKAYRLYVDNLMQKYELPDEKKHAIRSELIDVSRELDETIRHASSLLSRMTQLAAFAMTPRQDENILKYINILPVDEKTIVIMIVAESGKITNTPLRLKDGYDPQSLQLLSKVMTHNYRGKSLSSMLTMNILNDIETDMNALGSLAKGIMPAFMRTLENMLNVDLYVDGLENIFSIPEYSDLEKARGFMNVLSNRAGLTSLLNSRESGFVVTIGDENTEETLKDCTLITATYHVDGRCVGKIGVVGPTRIKYDEVTSVVEYLTHNLDNAFKLTEGDEDDGE